MRIISIVFPVVNEKYVIRVKKQVKDKDKVRGDIIGLSQRGI